MQKHLFVWYLGVFPIAMAFTGCSTTDVAETKACAVAPLAEEKPERSVPESFFEDLGRAVRVTVYLDMGKFPPRGIEGHAMLEAKRQLKIARPDLPGKFNAKSRVLKNSKNRSTGVYTYCVEYQVDTEVRKKE